MLPWSGEQEIATAPAGPRNDRRKTDKLYGIGWNEVICVVVTKHEGGQAMVRGKLETFREHWVFEDEKQGTARIYVRVEPCSEEQRKKNRERVDAAVREMWKSVQKGGAA